MDFETWSKPLVKDQMKKMIASKIDIDVKSSLAAQYGIKAIPAVVIIDASGNVLLKEIGYKSEEQMVNLLSGFPEEVEEIYIPLEQMDENPKNPKAICNLAKAYQEIAKSSSGKGKDVMIKSSNYYFSKAQKIFKKDKNNIELERINLYKCYNLILNERPKPAIKNLEKTGIENVRESNKVLCYFIAANAYIALEDKKNAQKYFEKLKVIEGANNYLHELVLLETNLK